MTNPLNKAASAAPAPVRPAPEIKAPPVVLTINSVLNLSGLRFTPRKSTLGITIHCSASRPSQNWGAKDVDRMHRAQGFICVGYHFIIRRDGTVEIGRPVNVEGGHARDGGRNKTHIGICMIGGISEKPQTHIVGNPWNGSDAENNFTPAQFTALGQLLVKLQGEFKLPDGSIEGHRDIKGVRKACPSFQVQRWLTTGEAVL